MAQEQPQAGAGKKPKSGWMNLLIDYGPLLVFFLVYRYYSRESGEIFAVVRSTTAFIIASLVALAVSRWRLGRISPMLWLSTALIVGFGGLTIFFQNEQFIQIKPTVIYLFFGLALVVGWLKGKALLQWLLEAAFEGVSNEGWLKLSRNWGFFFFFLALLNEILRYQLDFGDWLAAKLWVFMPLSFLFTFSQLPMLLKHGLAAEAVEEEETTLPPG